MTDEEFPTLSASANQGKKKKEKKTTTKLSLQEFNDSLPDAGSSWADQTSNLPTGPSLSEHRESSSRPFGQSNSGRDSQSRYQPKDNYQSRDGQSRFNQRSFSRDQEPRPVVEVPNAPPFKAKIGNLDYKLEEEEISNFFGELSVKGCELPREDGKPRGFCFVEFETKDDLIKALKLNGTSLSGRDIRIDVATPREKRFDNRNDRPERSNDRPAPKYEGVDDWRVRDPQLEAQRSERSERPERNDRYDRSERSDRNDRFDRSDRHDRSDRSDRPNSRPREPREQREQRDEGNWRTERQQPTEGKSITGVFENRQNTGRKPLNLKPRTVDKKDDDAPRAADSNKKDPFGGAKARDENLYQKKKQETPSS